MKKQEKTKQDKDIFYVIDRLENAKCDLGDFSNINNNKYDNLIMIIENVILEIEKNK